MIARLWHGWTSLENADQYERLLRSEVLPGIHRVPGYHGATLLRRDGADQVEFITITFFDSMEAVRRFAGDPVETAVVPPEARVLLQRFDAQAVHYQMLVPPPPLDMNT